MAGLVVMELEKLVAGYMEQESGMVAYCFGFVAARLELELIVELAGCTTSDLPLSS